MVQREGYWAKRLSRMERTSGGGTRVIKLDPPSFFGLSRRRKESKRFSSACDRPGSSSEEVVVAIVDV